MGGGSSSSTESAQETTNTQKDTTATGGGIAVGAEGQLYALDTSTNLSTGSNGGTILSLGDGASAVLQQLDKNTADLLLSAVAVLGNNANNFMTLSAGRNPDLKLADQTTETLAAAKTSPFLNFIQTNAGRLAFAALAALVIVAPVVILKRGKRRSK